MIQHWYQSVSYVSVIINRYALWWWSWLWWEEQHLRCDKCANLITDKITMRWITPVGCYQWLRNTWHVTEMTFVINSLRVALFWKIYICPLNLYLIILWILDFKYILLLLLLYLLTEIFRYRILWKLQFTL